MLVLFIPLLLVSPLAADEHVIHDLDPTRIYDVVVDGVSQLSSLQPAPDGVLRFESAALGGFQLVEAGQGDVTPPAAIDDLSASDVDAFSALLEWTAPGDDGRNGTAAGYVVRWSTSVGGVGDGANHAQTPPLPAAAGSHEAFRLPRLPSDTEIYVAVLSRDDAGLLSSPSNIVSFRTDVSSGGPPDPPGPPDTAPGLPLAAPSASFASGVITLEWQAAAGDVVGYHVYRRPEGGVEARLTTSPIAAPRYDDEDVTEGAAYIYRVTYVDDESNESPASPETWVRASAVAPPALAIQRVYPNPVRDQAVFRFAIPEFGPGSPGGTRVTIDLYDVAGRRVGRVLDDYLLPGVREVVWTPSSAGRSFTPGIYVGVIRAAGQVSRTNVAIAR